MTQTPPAADANSAATASELLSQTLEAFPDEKVQVGALIDYLDDRGYGLLLLLLALPMCVPNVPGISTPFGFLLLIPGLGMMLGARRPWIPGFIARRTIDRKALAGTINAAAPMVRKLEALFRPRLSFVTAAPFTVLLGIQVLVMALVLILPIPGGNWPPGMSVAMTGLAILQRDGVLAIASFVAAVAAFAIAWAVVYWFIVVAGPDMWTSMIDWLRDVLPGAF